jgi:hypothetical protein
MAKKIMEVAPSLLVVLLDADPKMSNTKDCMGIY